MEKILFISPSTLPVPAVFGGAIESLIQNFIDENEIIKTVQCSVISVYNEEAETMSRKYKLTNFFWIKKNRFSIIVKSFIKIINLINRLFNLTEIGLTYEGYIIRRMLKKNIYDKVIVEGNGMNLHYIKNLVPKERIVFHIHSYYHCEKNSLNLYLMRIPAKIISVSEFISESLVQNLCIHPESVNVVKNCINKYFIETNSSNTNRIKNSKEVSIVYTGRIVKEKGILELLDALILLKQFEWKLFLIGSYGSSFGSYDLYDIKRERSFVEQVNIRLNELRDHVEMLGFIENHKIPDYYNLFDIAVVPSICFEAAGLVVLEFIASGLPVIATNIGGIPEYLPKDSGFLINHDKNFIVNLSESLKELILNKELREIIKSKNLNIKCNFSSDIYYNNLIKALK